MPSDNSTFAPLRLFIEVFGDRMLFVAGLAAALPLAGWLGNLIG